MILSIYNESNYSRIAFQNVMGVRMKEYLAKNSFSSIQTTALDNKQMRKEVRN